MLIMCCFFKQKTAYEMRISDWSSDVCSSDLHVLSVIDQAGGPGAEIIRESRDRYFSSVKVPTSRKEQLVRMREYVELHLANGSEIKMIQPGVVCIKPIVAQGRCAEAGKLPNVGRCRMECR